MANINLVYLSPNTYGGWVTFTAHLIDAIQAAGHTPVLRKLGNNTENKTRDFGYGKWYRNTTEGDLYDLAIHEPTIIVAAARKFRFVTDELLSLGSKIVFHDPTEFKNLDEGMIKPENCVVVRQIGRQHIPGATFIRHPYQRMAKPGAVEYRSTLAVATSRIDFDKNTHILLDANRELPDNKKIVIRGFENRLYTKFKIENHYPEWTQSKAHYPREKETAFDLLNDANFLVDMSVIKGDGGGTQYTFLEAWDAGAVPIIHTDWLIDGDDMKEGYNCQSFNNGQELANFLNMFEYEDEDDSGRRGFVESGYEALKLHDPKLIGEQYARFILGE